MSSLFAAVLCCTLVSEDPAALEVVLSNGRSLRVLAAERDQESWILRFPNGSVTLALAQVAEVRAAGAAPMPTPPDPPRVDAVDLPAPAEQHRVEVEGVAIQVAIPSDFAPAASADPKMAVFVTVDGARSIRFAWSPNQDSFWSMGHAVKTHHRETYADYRPHGERYTTLGSYPAWLFTFGYTKGERTWRECQGFLLAGKRVLIISVTAPASGALAPDPLVRSLAGTLEVAESESAQ